MVFFFTPALLLVDDEAEEDVAWLDEGEEGVGKGVATGFTSTFSWEIVARIVGEENVKL